MQQPPNGYPPYQGQDPTTGSYPPNYQQPYPGGQTPPPGYPPNPYPQTGPQYPQNGQNFSPNGYPPPQQPPVKKKKKTWLIVTGVIVGALVLCGVFASHSGTSTTAPTSPSTNSTNNSQQQAPPSKPTSWQTTHTYTGSGTKKTETIAVPSDWKINWTCDPTSFDGMNYNVIIGVYNSDGTVADPAAINDMCKTGNTSGTTEERASGNIYLDVNSEGSWTITIQELK